MMRLPSNSILRGIWVISVLLFGSLSLQTDAAFAVDQQQQASKKRVEPAQDVYAKGMQLMAERPAEAAVYLRQAAEQGNRHAQYQLGLLYARGDGVVQDFTQARHWLHKASMQGHPKAMYHLGEMYARGDGGNMDFAEAFVWFWLSTSLGDPYAKVRLRAMSSRLDPEIIAVARNRASELWKVIPHDMKTKQRMLMH